MIEPPASAALPDWTARARSELRVERIVQILRAMVDTPSPSGAEGALARVICRELRSSGIPAEEQALDEQQSNAVGYLAGADNSAPLLLYSPIDTVLVGREEEDLPWAGAQLRADMRAESWRASAHVFGLGAHNPKGHAACVLAAGEAINRAGVPLQRGLYLGFGAGGMPSNARANTRTGSAHGAGCAEMLRRLPPIDSAVIAKSGWSVSWEEVGLAWIDVAVPGTHSYVGSRHLLPFTNAIEAAARLITRLEVWFDEWAQRHRSGLVAPQGVVSYIRSGWRRMPAFTPAVCQFSLDLRVSPRTSVAEVDAQFGAAFSRICAEIGVEASWRRHLFIPGTSTAESAPVVKRCIRAWEGVTATQHAATAGLSGATDANILRAAGIPTARVGLPKASLPDLDFELGMNAVAEDDLQRLSELLIGVALDHCLADERGAG